MKMVKTLILMLLPFIAGLDGNILARERAIFRQVTDHQHVEVEVTLVTDPAGHSCCVIAPPSLIEVYLLEGELALDAAIASGAPEWFSFGPMAIDDNFEFSGQSTATVAGFSNVQTTVTGVVEDGFISAKFDIGVGGNLPSGVAITYYTKVVPPTYHELYFARPIGALFGNPLVNGLGVTFEPRGISDDQPIDLAVAMDTGGETGDADWWLVLLHGDDFFYFDLTTGQFEPGLQSSFQGPLIDVLEPVQVLNQFNPSFTDEFTIVWGTDRTANGTLDIDSFRGNAFEYYFYQ